MHRRVARRFLIQELERAVSNLKGILRPLSTYPNHAGAILDGVAQVQEVLNLFDETEVDDPKLQRGLFVTRNFWNAQERKEHSNEWFEETGKYLLGFPEIAHRWLAMIDKVLVDSAPITINGIRVRNTTGQAAALEDLKPVIDRATDLVKARRWGSALRGDLKIVTEQQMPSAQRGHAGALYRNVPDEILLMWPSIDDRDLVERLIHEIGHRVWFQLLDPSYRTEWETSWDNVKADHGKFVSSYAGSDPKEDFAESFMHWVLRKPLGIHEVRLRAVGVG